MSAAALAASPDATEPTAIILALPATALAAIAALRAASAAVSTAAAVNSASFTNTGFVGAAAADDAGISTDVFVLAPAPASFVATRTATFAAAVAAASR